MSISIVPLTNTIGYTPGSANSRKAVLNSVRRFIAQTEGRDVGSVLSLSSELGPEFARDLLQFLDESDARAEQGQRTRPLQPASCVVTRGADDGVEYHLVILLDVPYEGALCSEPMLY